MKAAFLRGFCVALLLSAMARADSEIVVAIRYLQAKGESHSHLYLFREDGRLLRQLTKDDTGQEKNPVFSPDGETIVFTREVASEKQFWSVEPLGKNLRRLQAAPDWYANVQDAPYFGEFSEKDGTSVFGEDDKRAVGSYRAPDGSAEFIAKVDPKDEDDQIDGPGHGKHYVYRDLRSGQAYEFGKMPGFFGASNPMRLSSTPGAYFLLEGALRVAFFELHLDSTDGTCVTGLDLSTARLFRLGPNWTTPIPLPGEPAFLVYNFERYVPIPGSFAADAESPGGKRQRTANCSFVERWNAKLEKVRYAAEGSAARSYGFSMYRPKAQPAVVTTTIRDAE